MQPEMLKHVLPSVTCFYTEVKEIQKICKAFFIKPSHRNLRRREKINLNCYFHTSFWCLKWFYKGLTRNRTGWEGLQPASYRISRRIIKDVKRIHLHKKRIARKLNWILWLQRSVLVLRPLFFLSREGRTQALMGFLVVWGKIRKVRFLDH